MKWFKISKLKTTGILCELLSHYTSVGDTSTNFDWEIQATATALQQLLLRPDIFLVDSKSAMQSVTSDKHTTTQTAKEAREIIKLLYREGRIIHYSGYPHWKVSRKWKSQPSGKERNCTSKEAKRVTSPSFETVNRVIKHKTSSRNTLCTYAGTNDGKIYNPYGKTIKTEQTQDKVSWKFLAQYWSRLLAAHLQLTNQNLQSQLLYNIHQQSRTMDKDHLLVCAKLERTLQGNKDLSTLY